MPEFVKPGTAEYEEHKKAEIEHYAEVFEGFKEKQDNRPLFQPVPPAWVELETRSTNMIRALTGETPIGHIIQRMKANPQAKMLSLGSGPGGIELTIANALPKADILCTDFNPELLELGRQQAARNNVNVRFQEIDLNTTVLPQAEYDIVFCHASLHHVIELEHLCGEIRKSLTPAGVLVVVDIVSPSGYLMWPETRNVVHAMWKTLPAELRVNHTGYASGPKLDDDIWEMDTSQASMECIRSGDIIPVLQSTFKTEHYVPYFSVARRFVDTMYGPNYDMQNPLHLAIFNWIWELDCHYIRTGQLKPETFFGIYRG